MEYFVVFLIVLFIVGLITMRKKASPIPTIIGESKSKPSLKTKLVRVTKANLDGTNRQDIIRSFCKPGMKVHLRIEPMKSNSDNLDVYIAPPEMQGEMVQIGNIDPVLSHDLAPRLARGDEGKFTIAEVTGGEYPKFFGVNILIEPPDN